MKIATPQDLAQVLLTERFPWREMWETAQTSEDHMTGFVSCMSHLLTDEALMASVRKKIKNEVVLGSDPKEVLHLASLVVDEIMKTPLR